MTVDSFRKLFQYVVCPIAGLSLTIYDAVLKQSETPSRYVLWAAMMGYALLPGKDK